MTHIKKRLLFNRSERFILLNYIVNNSNFTHAKSVKRYRYLKLIQAFKNNLKQLL